MAKITTQVRTLLAIGLLVLLKEIPCDSNIGERSFSTSVVGMEILLETENQLLTAMENYAQKLEHKVNVIRGALTEMRNENLRSENHPEEYLSNPINSYALIRRLHEDSVNWENFLRSPVGADEISRIKELRADLPTSVDLFEATDAIYRLNAVYDISPADLTAGLIKGKQYDARFTAIDCFSIGYVLFKSDIYYLSQAWLNISLQLYQDSDINAVREFDKKKILQLHAKVLIKQDPLLDASDNTSNSPRNTNSTAAVLETIEQILEHEDQYEDQYDKQVQVMKYHCRPYTYQYRLHCLYNKTTSAFLQLAPLKMEILHLDPYVVLYHDVVSNAEIATLKKETGTKLERATTVSRTDGKHIVNSGRTVKAYWLQNTTTDLIERLHQRIADMSGFDLWDSEIIQMMNYGMAGHYATHSDFFNITTTSKIQRKQGDRIATVLFYMSDVEQGGATVFPEMQISVFPKKGTALMWYNLNVRAQADWRTMHGACPVIIGSKWIFTKWITQYSQMFRRRCYA